MYNLSGKTAMVTGGTRGLGAAMAIGLAEAGADIILIQRNSSNTRTKQAVEALGRRCYTRVCDMNDRESLMSLVPTITASYRVDILVNAAGMIPRTPAVKQSMENFDEVMQVNMTASWLLCQAMGKYWMEKGMRGKIVNMSSVQAHVGPMDAAPYAMSKAAVELMTRSLSTEWAAKGINVNSIAPGYCATDMNADIMKSGDAEFRKSASGRIPAERWGKPEDFKGPIVFLCCRASDYVHGATLVVDGGYLSK